MLQGDKGDPGYPGLDGSEGPIGAPGESGANGLPGQKGEKVGQRSSVTSDSDIRSYFLASIWVYADICVLLNA